MARYTIDLSDEVDARVQALASSLDVKTKADVFRKALGLLEYVVAERERGGKIIVENKVDGHAREIITL